MNAAHPALALPAREPGKLRFSRAPSRPGRDRAQRATTAAALIPARQGARSLSPTLAYARVPHAVSYRQDDVIPATARVLLWKCKAWIYGAA